MIIKTKFDLGVSVRDKITDFYGIIVAMYVYQHGCIRIEVISRTRTSDNESVSKVFDEPRLELVEGGEEIDRRETIDSEDGKPTYGERPNPSARHSE